MKAERESEKEELMGIKREVGVGVGGEERSDGAMALINCSASSE